MKGFYQFFKYGSQAMPERPHRSLDLFATRIWRFEFPELKTYARDWIKTLNEMRQHHGDVENRRSTHFGWSGPKWLLAKDSRFERLNQFANYAFSTAFREMGARKDMAYRLEAWPNIHDSGGYNTVHTHREAILSGCFYLVVPPGSGSILFRDPRPGAMYGPVIGNRVNCWRTIPLQPEEGNLLVFPNWLEHAVEPNLATEARYSIPINAIPMPRRLTERLRGTTRDAAFDDTRSGHT